LAKQIRCVPGADGDESAAFEESGDASGHVHAGGYDRNTTGTLEMIHGLGVWDGRGGRPRTKSEESMSPRIGRAKGRSLTTALAHSTV
jgi:hypothetical protein